MLFGKRILEYWDDIIRDLGEMIAIPSVCGSAHGDHPFGDEPAKAIDLAMKLAEGYGLKTKNVGYYACHAEIGEGEQNAVVMAHLDVVPAGEGWETDPYQMTIKDGYLYGRGVADNKGAAIVALHCLRALQDAGIQGKRKLRVVMGSGEEIGMEDMEHYFGQEQMPTMGFTPDAGYGVCNCEKGIVRFTVRGNNDSSVVKSFTAGTVVNAVPYKAEADIECNQEDKKALLEAASKSGDFVVTEYDNGAHILSKGVASHASSPEKGKNAASALIELLHSVFGDRIGTLLTFASEKIEFSMDGSKMGVACEDEPSGKLTFNLGLVQVTEKDAEFSVDIRYPATLDGNAILEKIKALVQKAGLEYCDEAHQAPLYLPKDGPLVQLLTSSYEDITGEKCSVFSMGGGTYARQMGGKGVAFGPTVNESDTNAHNCNERMSIEELKLHAQICLEAMYRMYTQEWDKD